MKLEILTSLLLIILLLTGLSFGLTGCKDKQSQTEQSGVSSEEYMELAEEPIFEIPIVEPNVLNKEKASIEQKQLPDEPNQ